MGLFGKLIPGSDDFFSDFEAQADAVVEGARLFKGLLDDFTDVPRKVQAIKDVEHRADDITHRAFARLHQRWFTPFDRAEVHRLLSRIDDVIDLTDGAASRLALYEIDSVLPDARELAAVLVAQTERMQSVIRSLRRLRPDQSAILAACREINLLENQADTLTRRTMAKLFRRANDPLTVMMWKEIVDLIEAATDRVEDVANVIEGLMIRRG